MNLANDGAQPGFSGVHFSAMPRPTFLRTAMLLLIAFLTPRIVSAQASAQAPPPQVTPTPTLVVMLTIDQLRPDYLTLFERHFTGGFARMLRGGAVFLNGFQDHAYTETAPGHASLLSWSWDHSPVRTTSCAGTSPSVPSGPGTRRRRRRLPRRRGVRRPIRPISPTPQVATT
jgi:hypothetical protein